MRTATWKNNIWHTIKPDIREIIIDVLQLLPVAAFLFISNTPAQSLAFMRAIEAPHRALEFVRDDTLLFVVRSGAGLLGASNRSLVSRLPAAASNITAGMAVRVLATAYSSTADQTDASPYTTASGATVGPNTLAANFLPFGTVVRIGQKLYTVKDRLNARYNGKSLVDLWFPSRDQALAFGVRVIDMEIVSIP